MPLFVKARSFLRNLFSWRSVDADLDQEVQSHLQMLVDDNVRNGMSQAEAQRAARMELGGTEQVKEQVRDERIGNWLQSVLADCRFALRQLRKNPGFTCITVLTLALGIGANTALLTVVESVLFRPLPYIHSDRLIYIAPKSNRPEFSNTSWLNYRDIREQAQSFEAVGSYSSDVAVIKSRNGSETAATLRVTPNVFSMLGMPPLLGRTFTESEGQPNGAPVVLLSEGLWRRSFNADPAIVGQTVKIGDTGRTVVGVMPQSMRFPEEMSADIPNAVWLPLQPTPEMLKDRGYSFFGIIGKLRPGITQQQAQAELDTIAQRIRKDNSGLADSDFGLRATLYLEVLTASVRPVLFALLGALALVLLIACANAANLLIARWLGRQQEFAVRAALGASRPRLMRQLVAEGAVLSLIGSSVGMALAELALAGVRKLPEGTIPRGQSIEVHWTIFLALAVIATLTTMLSSLLPAVLAARTDPQASLQAASRSTGTRSVRGRIAGLLVAGEVALSAVLLVGSGLLFRTLWNLEHAPLGFGVTQLTTFTAMPADSSGFMGMAVSEDAAHAPVSMAMSVYAPVLDRMRHMPGVEGAALSSAPPLSDADLHSSFEIVGQPNDHADQPNSRVAAISSDYARTLRTPVVHGRMVEESDTVTTPFVAVINESLARKFFAGRDPLQQQINLGGKDTGMVNPYTIVGVLADQVDSHVGGVPDPMIFLPYQQVPTSSLFYQALVGTSVNFVVKARGDVPVASAVRSVFHEIAPDLALDNFKTMQQVVDEHIFNQRLGLYLTGTFAGLAVMMVMAGLYGVLAQLVSYRRREIGIRMALGATRQSVAQMVFRQGVLLIVLGLAAGVALALAMGRIVRSFLYQVQPTDMWTYAASAIGLLIVGLLAALLPAHRAASIEPMQALRED